MIALLALIKKYWISVTLFFLTIITILSLYPLDRLPAFPGKDKTHHVIAYAVLVFPTALKKPNYWFIISLLLIGWSGAIELVQPYTNRYREVEDLAANIAGLACGFLLAQSAKWIFPLNPNQK